MNLQIKTIPFYTTVNTIFRDIIYKDYDDITLLGYINKYSQYKDNHKQ